MVLLLIRYGEIALKSKPVRKRMENTLIKNIKNAFSKNGIEVKVTSSFGRIFIECEKPGIEIIKKIFGIVSFSECFVCETNLEEIKNLAIELAKKSKFKTFAVKTRRMGKHGFSSQDVNIKIGSDIAGLGKKVDLTNPDKRFFIEIRDNKTYIYTEKINGQGGMPLGTQGRVILLAKNQKDILSGWLFMKRGCEVVVIGKGFELLEKWAFRKVKVFKTLEEAVRKEKPLGIVSSDFDKTKELKQELSLPVYNPLMGYSEKEIKTMLNDIG